MVIIKMLIIRIMKKIMNKNNDNQNNKMDNDNSSNGLRSSTPRSRPAIPYLFSVFIASGLASARLKLPCRTLSLDSSPGSASRPLACLLCLIVQKYRSRHIHVRIHINANSYMHFARKFTQCI